MNYDINKALCDGFFVRISTAQRIMLYSCACMAPMWLTTSVGVLN